MKKEKKYHPFVSGLWCIKPPKRKDYVPLDGLELEILNKTISRLSSKAPTTLRTRPTP